MAYDLWKAVVINESSQADLAGDVMIFRSAQDAETSLEAIDVRNGTYTAYGIDGRQLALSVEEDAVRLRLSSDTADHSVVVRRLLEETAQHVLQARQVRDSRRGRPFVVRLMELFRTSKREVSHDTKVDLPNLPLDTLVELIGFTR